MLFSLFAYSGAKQFLKSPFLERLGEIIEMLFRLLCLIYLLCHETTLAFAPRRPSVTTILSTRHFRTTTLHKSLFDEDYDESDDSVMASRPRKFTGQDYFTPPATSSGTGNDASNRPMTPREQMQQREYNLVSMATSPAAFLFQAGSVLVLLGFILYVGATGYVDLCS